MQLISGPFCALFCGVKLGLKVARGLVSDGRVFVLGVVVAFDVLEDFNSGVPCILEASILEHFEFQQTQGTHNTRGGFSFGAKGRAPAHLRKIPQPDRTAAPTLTNF